MKKSELKAIIKECIKDSILLESSNDIKKANELAKVFIKLEKDQKAMSSFTRLAQNPTKENSETFKVEIKRSLSSSEYNLITKEMGI